MVFQTSSVCNSFVLTRFLGAEGLLLQQAIVWLYSQVEPASGGTWGKFHGTPVSAGREVRLDLFATIRATHVIIGWLDLE